MDAHYDSLLQQLEMELLTPHDAERIKSVCTNPVQTAHAIVNTVDAALNDKTAS